MGVAIKGQQEDLLFLDSIKVSILVVMVHHEFVRCYHCGEWSKGYTVISVLFVTHACEVGFAREDITESGAGGTFSILSSGISSWLLM